MHCAATHDPELAEVASATAFGGLCRETSAVGRLDRRQADVQANKVIMAHLRATSDVKGFLPGVASEVSRALGTDDAGLIATTSC